MIHYHGLPITPNSTALAAIKGGHAFVSFAHAAQLSIAAENAQSFAVDNGAFSAWASGKPIKNWESYYDWVENIYRLPSFDFAVIPDVIEGTEAENDDLIEQWPWVRTAPHIGAPVWHMHESFERLLMLAKRFPRICLGSSGQFSTVGDSKWWGQMIKAMDMVTTPAGHPICKLHGLRMLNVEVFTKLPLSSADSTNIGRNVGLDSCWKGTYTPPSKDIRALVMRSRIEEYQSALVWEKFAHVQNEFELE